MAAGTGVVAVETGDVEVSGDVVHLVRQRDRALASWRHPRLRGSTFRATEEKSQRHDVTTRYLPAPPHDGPRLLGYFGSAAPSFCLSSMRWSISARASNFVIACGLMRHT